MVDSRKLVELMEERGVSATDLAKKVGVSDAAMSYFRQGLKQPSVETLVRISAALGCKVDDLIKAI